MIVILNEDNYGYYYLTCVSTNGQVDTEKNLALQVSNSKLLQVETYEPKTSMIGIPFEVISFLCVFLSFIETEFKISNSNSIFLLNLFEYIIRRKVKEQIK